MSQMQNTVMLVLLNGQRRDAVATGNNAAWICECPRKVPLIGRTGSKNAPSAASIVECPDCQRRYVVVPEDKDLGRVSEVRETI
jgi:hypothetical protein